MNDKRIETFESDRLKEKSSKERMGWKSYLAIAAAIAFLIMMMAVSVKAFMPIPDGRSQARNSQGLKDRVPNNAGGSEATETGDTIKLSAIAAPQYPAKKEFNFEQSFKRQNLDKGFLANLQDFLSRSASAVLSAGDSGGNQVFSPVSLYVAMAMMADGASGETRNEILNAMSMGDFNMATVAQQINQLYKNLYFDNNAGHLQLASSLWLAQGVPVKEDFLQSLAQNYFTASFRADFSDAQKTAEQIDEWTKENTEGNLGQDEDGRFEFSSPNEAVMATLSTANFRDEWSWPFLTTAQAQFHLPDGTATACQFMDVADLVGYLKGSNYTASSRDLANGGKMVFILPDQGVSLYELIKNPRFVTDTIDALFKSTLKEVTFRVPEFKYENRLDLNSAVEKMGIKKAFLSGSAEFPNITDLKPFSLFSVEQAASISVDVLGCEATAHTSVSLPLSGDPENLAKVDLTLDRPFIFVVTGAGDNNYYNQVPILVGIVNNPAE